VGPEATSVPEIGTPNRLSRARSLFTIPTATNSSPRERLFSGNMADFLGTAADSTARHSIRMPQATGSIMALGQNTGLGGFSFNFDMINNTNNNDFLEPIPVIPNANQIMVATEVIQFSYIQNPNNNRCPISLIQFEPDDMVTRIRYCGHIYSGEDLGIWFRQNVRCPLCRYDIRSYSADQPSLFTHTTPMGFDVTTPTFTNDDLGDIDAVLFDPSNDTDDNPTNSQSTLLPRVTETGHHENNVESTIASSISNMENMPRPPSPTPTSYPAPTPTSYPAPTPTSCPAPTPTSYPAPTTTSYPAPTPTSYPAPTPTPTSYPTATSASYPAPTPTSYPASAQTRTIHTTQTTTINTDTGDVTTTMDTSDGDSRTHTSDLNNFSEMLQMSSEMSTIIDAFVNSSDISITDDFINRHASTFGLIENVVNNQIADLLPFIESTNARIGNINVDVRSDTTPRTNVPTPTPITAPIIHATPNNQSSTTNTHPDNTRDNTDNTDNTSLNGTDSSSDSNSDNDTL